MWKREGFFSFWQESEIHLPPIPIPFLSSNVQIQNKDCVLENTITEEKWSFIGQYNDYPLYCFSVVQPLKIFPQKALVGSLHEVLLFILLVKINQNSKLRFLPRIGREVEGKNWKEKVNFSLSKFWILRREYVCKISFIWEEKFFFKISNSERRTRIFSSKSWQSRLYREMKIQFSSARETFPLEIFSRSRISSMPWRRGLCGCWGSLVGWSSLRWTKFYTNIVEY